MYLLKALRKSRPILSIVVVFYNMRREAARTLYSLTTEYQLNVKESDYEVLVIDSHSSAPLDPEWVASLQSNFRYFYVESTDPTPCNAMNQGIANAQAPHVACAIDGARILSPGVISKCVELIRLDPSVFVFTIGMHLGPKPQSDSVLEGYNQTEEDRLLSGCAWKENGYQLFDISAVADSSRKGYFGALFESNFFVVNKSVLNSINGFDERFKSPGGGLVNLHVFDRLLNRAELRPFMLLGEASFHQFHQGVAANAPRGSGVFAQFQAEYSELFGRPLQLNWRAPEYFGALPEPARRLMTPQW